MGEPGRPEGTYKFTPDELARKVDEYFDSITRDVPLEDLHGDPVLNRLGQQVVVLKYIVPPSIASLCIYLGIVKQTWQNYKNIDIFKDICAQAKLRIEAYLMHELDTRDKPNGVIFDLQNNFGMSEKHEVDAGEKTRKTFSLAERKALILEAAKGLSEAT